MSRALALGVAALVGCAAAPAAKDAAPGGPGPEDRRVLAAAHEVEQRMAMSGRIHDDPTLELYVREVASRLAPPSTLDALGFHPRVVDDPVPYQVGVANGAAWVSTGLLARLESEGELAAVLGHQLSHLERRDAADQLRKDEEWSDEIGSLRTATVARHARELELAADADAVARMRAAGYDPADALRMLERLRAYSAAIGRKQVADPQARTPAFDDRIAACRRLLAQRGAEGGARNEEAYAKETAGLLVPVAQADLDAGRLAAARQVVGRRVKLAPSDARAQLLLGEVTRREGTSSALDLAASAYRRAVELDPRLAFAWRGLGLVLEKRGRRDEARAAFARYLELAPDAPDRAHVEAALRAAP